jgi:hypothetical protein
MYLCVHFKAAAAAVAAAVCRRTRRADRDVNSFNVIDEAV